MSSSGMDDIVSALPEWMQYSGRHPEIVLGPWLLGILFDFLLQLWGERNLLLLLA